MKEKETHTDRQDKMIRIVDIGSGAEAASFSTMKDALFYCDALKRLRNLKVKLVNETFEIGDTVIVGQKTYEIIQVKLRRKGQLFNQYTLKDSEGKVRKSRRGETIDPTPETLEKYKAIVRMDREEEGKDLHEPKPETIRTPHEYRAHLEEAE